jgi:hypothetical protein
MKGRFAQMNAENHQSPITTKHRKPSSSTYACNMQPFSYPCPSALPSVAIIWPLFVSALSAPSSEANGKSESPQTKMRAIRRADADIDGPGAIKNAVIVSAPKYQAFLTIKSKQSRFPRPPPLA